MSNMDTVKLGNLAISRFILGSNPFSGFSHQGEKMDYEMMHYYSLDRTKETLRQAEQAGITTLIARADNHIIRLLMEYWDEGGKLQWVAQTCPQVGPTEKVADMAIRGGAKAVYVHGGVMDHSLAHKKMADPIAGIKLVQAAGLPVGVAGHNPAVFPWAEKHLQVDFYMCCYYNAAHRDKSAAKDPNQPEWFLPEDRQIMAQTIQTLTKPVIHYKIMAAGRNNPEEAFGFAAKTMRKTDAICVGVYTHQNPTMVADDVMLFETAWKREKGGA